jgi:hypothetical protein
VQLRVALALLFVSVAGVAEAAPSASKVDQALLRPAQVGAGYTIPNDEISRSLQEATLDLCFGTFVSEARRVERIQVGYSRLDVEDVSNEVVRYGPGGAKLALKEARAISCKNKKQKLGAGSVTMTVRRIAPAGAPPGAVTLSVKIVTSLGGQRRQLVGTGIYLVRGNLLSGVYVYDATSPSVARAVRLAKVAARNLARAG